MTQESGLPANVSQPRALSNSGMGLSGLLFAAVLLGMALKGRALFGHVIALVRNETLL